MNAGSTSQAILFDLDRTLVDLQSFTDYAAAWESVRALLGESSAVTAPETDWDRPTQACMSALVAVAGTSTWQEASDAIARHERAAIPESMAMPRLTEAMDLVKDWPVAVITLLPPDVAREVLAHHGVQIDVVVGRQPGSRPKPHGDGLILACEALSVDPASATMIGDATWDLAAAIDAGAGFIGVPFSAGAFPDGTRLAADLTEAVSQAMRG